MAKQCTFTRAQLIRWSLVKLQLEARRRRQEAAKEERAGGDKRYASVMRSDANDFERIVEKIEQGRFQAARMIADSMDTEPRDNIPSLTWRDLLGGELAGDGERAAPREACEVARTRKR